MGGDGARSKWSGEPPYRKSVSVSRSRAPRARARRSCAGGRDMPRLLLRRGRTTSLRSGDRCPA
eukprot:1107838-Pyramimonas_sp.AAC.1